jgi:hypothetical protein
MGESAAEYFRPSLVEGRIYTFLESSRMVFERRLDLSRSSMRKYRDRIADFV